MKKSQVHSFAYISIFLVVISVIVYLNIVFQENLKADITRQFNRQQLLLARGASLSIEKQVEHYVKNLVTISQIPTLSLTEKNFQNDQIISTLLDDMPHEDPTVVDFEILDSRGVIKFDRVSPALAGRDLSDRIYFVKSRELLKGEVYISEPMTLRRLNPDKRYVVITTPIFKGGKFNGAALFAISVDDIAGEFVSQIRMGDKGYAWVMDSHGRLVYHPEHPEMIGKDVRKAGKSCYSCHRSFDAEKKILEGAVMEYGVYTAPMGEDKLISYSRARVGAESWLVCVTMPYSEVTGLIAKSMKLYSWLISLIFFTVIGTSIFFIILIKKNTEADERVRYAAELEDRISERTAELTAEKEKLNAVLSGFGACVSLIDSEYKIQWANEVITSNVKYPVGDKCYSAYRNRTSPCPECVLQEVFRGGEIAQAEIVCRKGARQDGLRDYIQGDLLAMLTEESVGNFQIIIAPIKDADGHVRQVVELIQDISAMRRLEQQMMHSEKLAALGRISAGIAHEIGNPLTAIYSYVQILQGNVYDEFTNNTLDTMAFHLNRIKEILQQMSGFSRSYTMEKAPVDLNEAVKAAFDLMGGHESSLKDSEFAASYCPEKLMVMADEKWLVSVFVNLALNALDAMTKKGRLTVRTYLDKQRGVAGEFCVAEVSDTGIGIAPENLARIFDPFYTTKQTGKGTGLGLAVSYNIIKDLRGEISVVSQLGEGTTFKVRLPLMDTGEREGEKKAGG